MVTRRRLGLVILILLLPLWAATPVGAVSEYLGFMAGSGSGGATAAGCGFSNAGYFWLVTGTPPGSPPLMQLWAIGSSAQLVAQWYAYDPGFVGGVDVSCVYVYPYLFMTTAPGPGGGPHVRVWYHYAP